MTHNSHDFQAKTMGMKAIPASNVVIEELNLQGIMTPEQFLKDRETFLHKTFSSAKLMPGRATFALVADGAVFLLLDLIADAAVALQLHCTHHYHQHLCNCHHALVNGIFVVVCPCGDSAKLPLQCGLSLTARSIPMTLSHSNINLPCVALS